MSEGLGWNEQGETRDDAASQYARSEKEASIEDRVRAAEKLAGEVECILNERHNRYGDFDRTANVAQALKRVIFDYRSRDDYRSFQIEGLEMIATKLARIVNGDPDYIDNWQDIAGYAQLVADRLGGVAR